MESLFFFVLWFFLVVFNILAFTYLSAREKTSSYLISALAVYIVLANLVSVKIIKIGKFLAPAGIVIYSLTFLINDILGEIFGKKEAQKAMLAGFLLNLFFILIIYLTIISPYPQFPFALKKHEEFKNLFGLTARLIIASLSAYLISQNVNILLFHFLRNKTRGKLLWLRNNLSTILSQVLDTFTFILIGFYKTVPLHVLANLIIGQLFLKGLIALCDTPFLYFSLFLFQKFKKK